MGVGVVVMHIENFQIANKYDQLSLKLRTWYLSERHEILLEQVGY